MSMVLNFKLREKGCVDIYGFSFCLGVERDN